MKMMKMCLNWKVAAGLAAVGAGIWVYAPGAFAAALPLLFLALCPLSMLAMMAMMGGSKEQTAPPANAAPPEVPAPESGLALQQLEAELAHVRARQTALADQLEATRREQRQHL